MIRNRPAAVTGARNFQGGDSVGGWVAGGAPIPTRMLDASRGRAPGRRVVKYDKCGRALLAYNAVAPQLAPPSEAHRPKYRVTQPVAPAAHARKESRRSASARPKSPSLGRRGAGGALTTAFRRASVNLPGGSPWAARAKAPPAQNTTGPPETRVAPRLFPIQGRGDVPRRIYRAPGNESLREGGAVAPGETPNRYVPDVPYNPALRPYRNPGEAGAPTFPRASGEAGNHQRTYATLKPRSEIRLTVGDNLFRVRLYYFSPRPFLLNPGRFSAPGPGSTRKIETHKEARKQNRPKITLRKLNRQNSEIKQAKYPVDRHCNASFISILAIKKKLYAPIFAPVTPYFCWR